MVTAKATVAFNDIKQLKWFDSETRCGPALAGCEGGT